MFALLEDDRSISLTLKVDKQNNQKDDVVVFRKLVVTATLGEITVSAELIVRVTIKALVLEEPIINTDDIFEVISWDENI